jgi:SAM-dependent methyltransferase
VGSERWQDAQRAERSYWEWKSDVIRDPDYRKHIADRADRVWELVRARVPTPQTAVEIGGGATQLIDYMRVPRRIGVDPLMAFYRERFGDIMDPAVKAVTGVGEQVPLPDGWADIVIQRNVLDHVADPASVCRETRRILRPGGVAYIALNGFSGPLYWLRRFKKQQEHPFAFSSPEARRLVADSGLSIVESIEDAGETLEEVHEIESPRRYRRAAKRLLIAMDSYHFVEIIARKPSRT